MSLAAPAPELARRGAQGDRCRVLLCDDSAVIRAAIVRILERDPDIQIVGAVGNGQAAIDHVKRFDVDVVVLDIEMPVMDGMTALPLILKARPGVKVMIASTLTRRNAAISIKALTLGATDYVAKPDAGGIHGAEAFGTELIAKVKAVAAHARRNRSGRAPAAGVAAALGPAPEPAAPPSAPIVLRPKPLRPPKVLVVGSSTGGPQALDVFFGQIGAPVAVPILIVQHMPPTFTALLAESLTKSSGIQVTEGRDGEPVLPGRAYIAPGDFHMTVEGSAAQPRIKVFKAPAENFCRPAVDPLLRGVTATYGAHALAVILTGMGSDGCKGAQALVEAGGFVFAQDEPTSVVWGMPGAVARAGLCSAVLPLTRLANEVKTMVKGRSA